MVDNGQVLDFFNNRLLEKSELSARNYSKVLLYLDKFASIDGRSLAHPTTEMLEDWCQFLYRFGFQTKTVMHYLDIYSALHRAAVERQLAEPTKHFKTVKAKVKNGDFEKLVDTFSTESYDRLHRLLANSNKLPREKAMYLDLFVISLLSGCKPVTEIAMLKKSDIDSQSSPVATILEKNCATNRQYIFPLSQHTLTPLQLHKHLEQEISSILASHGIKVSTSVRELARSYWTYEAIKRGLSITDAYAALGKLPVAMPDIARNASATKTSGSKDVIIANIGEAVLENPVNWYAMKLRHVSKFDELKRRIKELDPALRPAEIFYPAQEISKRVRGNKKIVTRAIIPGVVFFKSLKGSVQPLFAHIGDLAWCYKAVEDDKQYAVISRNEMMSFQRAVGQFTSDFEVGPIGSIEPREGDIIRVVGGIFDGQEGELIKVINKPETGVIYRLKIIDGQGVEWRVALDPRHADL